MAVKARDHPVRLPARFANPAQVVLDVGLAAGGGLAERFAANDVFAEQLELFLAFDAGFGFAVEVLAIARARLLETEFAVHALERIEGRAVDGIGVAEWKRIDPRAAAHVGPLRAGAVPGAVGRGGRHQCYPAGLGLEIAGHARLGKVLSATGTHDPR